MKKFNKILLFIIIFIIISIQTVIATSLINMNPSAKTSFNNFFKCINAGDDNIYNYIDTSNTELYNNVETYLHSLSINYEITNITEDNNNYNIETKIAASGIGWNVNGLTVSFELKEINNEYKITDTNLFDVIGTKNVFLYVLKIFAILACSFLIVAAIIATVIIIIVTKVRKKNSNE